MLIVSKADLKIIVSDLVEELAFENSRNEVLTIKEVADLMKISVPTVRKLIDTKAIPYFQQGQIIRFKQSEIIKYLSSNK